MTVKITYFVHGATRDNERGCSTGWNDEALTELGEVQNQETKDKMGDKEFDVIFSSDLKRAAESAKAIFPGREIMQDERLRECNYGDLNGADEKLVVYEDHIAVPFPNGEALADVEKRIKDFCEFLLLNYDDKRVAVVAHRAPQLAFEVVTDEKEDWDGAIENDWRKVGKWQPGWEYEVSSENKFKGMR